jgi:hypothetical protein
VFGDVNCEGRVAECPHEVFLGVELKHCEHADLVQDFSDNRASFSCFDSKYQLVRQRRELLVFEIISGMPVK